MEEYSGPIVTIHFRDQESYSRFSEDFDEWLVDPVYDPDKAQQSAKEMGYGPLGFYVPRHWKYGDPLISTEGVESVVVIKQDSSTHGPVVQW